jgi:hypothetical protein
MKMKRCGWTAMLCAGAALFGAACADGEVGADLGDEVDEAGEIDVADLPPMAETRVVAEVALANGNDVTFFAFTDGSIAVEERGSPNTNAIGTLPEMHGASALEIFRAVAPGGAEPPAALVVDHERVAARRKAEGRASPMREGFRVASLDGFLAREPLRSFNACTSNGDWMDHVGTSPIGSNCPGAAGKDWYACWTGFALPDDSACAGVACTKYFTNGYNQVRASACARAGDGHVRFVMGIKDDAATAWSTWFDHVLHTGSYYYYWYSSGTDKDFWHLLFRTDDRLTNWSLWLDDL